MITKNSPDPGSFFEPAGDSLLVDKPLGWSSFKVIYFLRKNTPMIKAGHAGTLDPLATGLLIVCSGKKTKEISTFQDLPKEYTGSFRLGQRTASMDAETPVIEERSFEHITEEMILATAVSFTGEQFQTVPMYSAVNFQGKKLYELARKGKVVHREPRQISIHYFEITSIDLPIVSFKVGCSKGVYIRSLANDFGEKLGCGAYLTGLRRTKIGTFSVDDAFEPDDFKKISDNLLIPKI